MKLINTNAVTMANLDAYKSLQQFAGAAKWAGVKANTVMRADEMPTADQTLTISTTDRPLGLFHFSRGEYDQQANNETRQNFLKALMQTYGITSTADLEQSLPKSVKKVLKLKDFALDADGNVTSGKPLTSRRIKSIMTELGKFGDLNKLKDLTQMDDNEIATRLETTRQGKVNVFIKSVFASVETSEDAEKALVKIFKPVKGGENPIVRYLSEKLGLSPSNLKLGELAGLLIWAVRSGLDTSSNMSSVHVALRWHFEQNLNRNMKNEDVKQCLSEMLEELKAAVKYVKVDEASRSDVKIAEGLLHKVMGDGKNAPDWLENAAIASRSVYHDEDDGEEEIY